MSRDALRDHVVGALPAPITNPEVWPAKYADGWNDCAQIALEGVREAFASPPAAVAVTDGVVEAVWRALPDRNKLTHAEVRYALDAALTTSSAQSAGESNSSA